MCTHLNDKLVCTQIHNEHLGRQQEERQTVTDCKVWQQKLCTGDVSLLRVFLHLHSHTVEATVHVTVKLLLVQD